MNSHKTLAFIAALCVLFISTGLLYSKMINPPKIVDDTILISINEVMASNGSAVADEDGEYSDWVEIYNYGDDAVDLAGYGLSDKESNPFKWVFPAVSIAPGEYMLIWASGKDKLDPEAPLHTNFSIKAEGEEVLLTHHSGLQIDLMEPVPMASDISYGRYPNGTGAWFFYDDFTPGAPNPEPVLSEELSPPLFSYAGGFYDESFELVLSHPNPEVSIIYTLDGSEPDIMNLEGTSYQYKNSYPYHVGDPFGEFLTASFTSLALEEDGIIEIRDRSGDENYLSMFSAVVALEPNYMPTTLIKKATLVRAKAYAPDGSMSGSVSHSYFLFPEGRQHYALPVISVGISENHLFDYYDGIYTAGVDYDEYRQSHPFMNYNQFDPSNWHRRGSEWEFPGSFEFFDFDQSLAKLRQNVGIRLNGGATRSLSGKTLRLYAKNDPEKFSFDHKFFPDRDFDSFKRLLIRNGGQNWNKSLMHDGAVQAICSGLSFHTQAYQPAILYMNSEFWGIFNIRERFDKYLIARNFGANPDNIDFLEDEGVVEEGNDEHFLALIEYALSHDMSDPDNYQHLNTLIDVENFIDYAVAQVFTSNYDWPFKNIRYFRNKTDAYEPDAPYGLDGRWRWMMHDMDISFSNMALVERNSLQELYNSNTYFGVLYRALLAAPEFEEQFYSRFLDLMVHHFSQSRMLGIINEKADEIQSIVLEHSRRWRLPTSLNDWNSYINGMRDFAENRGVSARSQLKEFFELGDEFVLTLDTNHAISAKIGLNSITLDGLNDAYASFPLSAKYHVGMPIELVAEANEGYVFSHWEGDVRSANPKITIYPQGDIHLKAMYIIDPQTHMDLVHYWHFNDLPGGEFTEVPSDFSIGEQGMITYPGTGDGYMDKRTHRAQDPVSNLNLQMGVLPDQGAVLRVRNPSDTRELLIQIPSAGFENISVAFASARTSNGAETQEFYYSVDGGDNWVFVRDYSIIEIPEWELYRFDLGSDSAANNNPDLVLKILFTGDSASNDSGNDRFDNFSVFAMAKAPQMTLLEDHLDFGNCSIGANMKKSFSVKNESDFDVKTIITIPEGFLLACPDSEMQSAVTSIEYSFAAFSTTSFDLYFIPEKEGSYDSELKIFHHVLGEELTLALSAMGSFPEQNKLFGAFPNPFAENTNITYEINDGGKVEFSIYNIKGQMVRMHSIAHDTKGHYRWRFDARDQNSRKLSSGVYLIKMSFGKYVATKKIIIVK